MAKVVFLGPGEGRLLVVGPNTTTLKAVTDDTEGASASLRGNSTPTFPAHPFTCTTSWITPFTS
jgi:hypothetical protein